MFCACSSNPAKPGSNFNKVPEGGAQTYMYEGSFDTVWNATLEIMKTLESEDGMLIKEQDKEKGYIYAKKSMGMVSAGENVTVRVKALDDSKCSVEVVTKRIVQTKAWTFLIHKSLADVLHRVGN